MLTPAAARELSGANKWLARFEDTIRENARQGHRTALLTYTDCNADELAAIEELRKAGFEVFRHSERSGGVLQHAAYYARW